MSEEWLEVTPAAFCLEDDNRKGRVFRAATQGPPLKVKEIKPEEWPSDRATIVVEFENAMKVSAEQMGASDSMEFPERLAFHARDARFLCVSLIHALADGGDRIAQDLATTLNKIDWKKFKD